MKQTLILCAISLFLVFISCSKSSELGGDIVGVDDYETHVSYDININAKTVNTSATRVFSKGQNPSEYQFLGKIQDPVFGESKAEIYAQFLLASGSFFSKFTDPVVDSVVLTMQYDSLSLRGRLRNSFMDLQVHRITEQLSNQANYYSNSQISYDQTPVGKLINSPVYGWDSLKVKTPVNGKIIDEKLVPHLRIPLDKSLGEELLGYDSLYYVSNSRFGEKFMGLHLSADVENTLLAFNMLSGTGSLTALNVYYKEDTVPKLFKFYVTRGVAVSFSTYEHDYSNSIVEQFMNGSEAEDSLLFLQGMAGVEIELEIEDLRQFEDKVINLAELTMYYADIPGIETLMPDEKSLTITQSVDERDVLISDAENAELSSNPAVARELFGGNAVVIDSTLKKTSFKVPVYFQEIVRGKYKPVVKIRPRTKNISADKGIFYGPNHPKYPMTLKVVYTEID